MPINRKRASRSLFALTVALSLAAAAVPQRATGSELVVTSLADSGPGTLRDTVASANLGDTIGFGVTGTIHLESGIEIAKDLTIRGPATTEDTPPIRLDGGGKHEVLRIQWETSAAIENLTIANGLKRADGEYAGGITNFGSLTLTDCLVTGNEGKYGGGIYNRGKLEIYNSRITQNTGDYGGGIAEAWYTGGDLTVVDSIVADNSARSGGGGISAHGGGETRVQRTSIESNNAHHGGGIDGSALVEHSVLRDNEATSGSGGGGYFFDATIVRSAIIGNRALSGGGIYGSHRVVVANSTIAGNSGPVPQGDGQQQSSVGAGIHDRGRMRIVNSTIVYNSAADSEGGGVRHDEGHYNGARYDLPTALINTIIAHNDGGNCFGDVAPQGGNLQFPGRSCGDTAESDPLLPAFDPDPSVTSYAPISGSPAIGAGAPVPCSIFPVLGVDQLGHARPTAPGGTCDIGAVEVASDITPTPGFRPLVTPTPEPPDLVPGRPYLSLRKPFTCYWPDMDVGLYAPVYNFGEAAAGSFVVDASGFRQTVAGLEPRKWFEPFYNRYPNYEVTVKVDADDEVAETREDNNSREDYLPMLTMPPYCTVTPTPGGPTPSHTATGTELTATSTATNEPGNATITPATASPSATLAGTTPSRTPTSAGPGWRVWLPRLVVAVSELGGGW